MPSVKNASFSAAYSVVYQNLPLSSSVFALPENQPVWLHEPCPFKTRSIKLPKKTACNLWLLLYLQIYTNESAGGGIMKIGQHLAKLQARAEWRFWLMGLYSINHTYDNLNLSRVLCTNSLFLIQNNHRSACFLSLPLFFYSLNLFSRVAVFLGVFVIILYVMLIHVNSGRIKWIFNTIL